MKKILSRKAQNNINLAKLDCGLDQILTVIVGVKTRSKYGHTEPHWTLVRTKTLKNARQPQLKLADNLLQQASPVEPELVTAQPQLVYLICWTGYMHKGCVLYL